MKVIKDDFKAVGGIREGKTTARTSIIPGILLKITIASGPKKKTDQKKTIRR
jgi:hypothetical protein